MRAVLLIDFGSTFTKVTAVDAEGEAILGVAQSETTAATDVAEGRGRAVKALEEKTGPVTVDERYACSSAAGGLKMIAAGLVPSLTAEAAKRAALGAGAKVVRTFSYELTGEDLSEIARIAPDILLLTGGHRRRQPGLHPEKRPGAGLIPARFPVVVAGNRAARDECLRILTDAGCRAIAART
jgi:uncharacterized protein (TIGR01319 family)